MKKVIIATVAVLLLLSVAAFTDPGDGGWFGCPLGQGPGDGPGMGQAMGQRGGHGMGMGMRQGMGMRMGPHAGMGPRMLLMNADELELTDAQKTQLETMATQFQIDRVDKRAALEKAEIQFRSLMMKGDASQKDVDAAIDNVAGLRADMQKMRYAHVLKAKGVLTAGQIDKLKEIRKNRWTKRGFGAMRGDRDQTRARIHQPGNGN